MPNSLSLNEDVQKKKWTCLNGDVQKKSGHVSSNQDIGQSRNLGYHGVIEAREQPKIRQREHTGTEE